MKGLAVDFLVQLREEAVMKYGYPRRTNQLLAVEYGAVKTMS